MKICEPLPAGAKPAASSTASEASLSAATVAVSRAMGISATPQLHQPPSRLQPKTLPLIRPAQPVAEIGGFAVRAPAAARRSRSARRFRFLHQRELLRFAGPGPPPPPQSIRPPARLG
jgi:hypothetical protein